MSIEATMSALGQKQTFAVQNGMSALPPIADIGRRILLSPLHNGLRAMGYNARNDEIHDNVTRMRREWEADIGGASTLIDRPTG